MNSGSLGQAWLGLDVGGTAIKSVAFRSDGRVLAEETEPTFDDSTPKWLERARALAQRVLQRLPGGARVGVAAPGLASADGASISYMPGRLPGLEGLNWQSWLGLEGPVPVFNDAHAALLGETWLGAARGAKNVVLLTLGTGVGGAVMVDGRILRGHMGRAGHLGHVSLDPNGPLDIVNTPGSLEDAIGEHSLSARSGGHFASTRQLVGAVRSGSSDAVALWQKSLRSLAAALAGFINLFDPERIVIGGGIAEAGATLFEPLQTELDRFEWRPGGARVRLVKAELGRNAGAAGAAFGAKLAFERGPEQIELS